MATDTGEQDTEQEVDASKGEDESSPPKEETGEVKVPEEFQKEAMALVQGCKTIACLDFLSNEVNEMRTKLMSSQKKAGLNRDDFSEVDMPADY